MWGRGREGYKEKLAWKGNIDDWAPYGGLEVVNKYQTKMQTRKTEKRGKKQI